LKKDKRPPARSCALRKTQRSKGFPPVFTLFIGAVDLLCEKCNGDEQHVPCVFLPGALGLILTKKEEHNL